MNPSLLRVAALESRLASTALWARGRRKRGVDWVCEECRAKRASRQRRAYGDDSLRVSAEHFLFPPRSAQNDGEKGTAQAVDPPRWAQKWQPWGIDTKDREPSSNPAAAEEGDMTIAELDTLEAVWEQTEQAEEDSNAQITAREEQRQATMKDSLLLNVDYVTQLPLALADNEPDMVARCLYTAEREKDFDFIRSIPRTSFAECIRVLQPCNFTEPLTSAHLEITEGMTHSMDVAPIQSVAWRHASVLQTILNIRRDAGIPPGLPEYKMLLRAARDLGQARMAARLWQFLLADGLSPDTACYNYMMAANVWNNIHQPLSRWRVRVIPPFQEARQKRHPGPRYTDFRVGPGGLKEQVIRIFSDMLKHGAVADEESFRNVILAAAREGDLTTVKSVLRRVWDIDVDALVADNADATVTPAPIPETSPIHPTSKLLYAIAHAFGINNDIPTALRVVDFVARRFQIHIADEVWHQLFEWTFVLASKRTNVDHEQYGTKTGQLPIQSVMSLWETMTGAPYFVKPTMGMYNRIIRHLHQIQLPDAMLRKMSEAFELYMASRRDERRARRALESNLDAASPTSPSVSLENARREWEYRDLIRKRNRFWFKRWMRLLLSSLRDFNYLDIERHWGLRKMPAILWQWRNYAPTLVQYEVAGGTVEFYIRTLEDVKQSRSFMEGEVERRAHIREEIPMFIAEDWTSSKPPSKRNEQQRKGKTLDDSRAQPESILDISDTSRGPTD